MLFFPLSLLASVSIRYEIISDWGVYTIPYSFHRPTVFISVLKLYRIHHHLRVREGQYGMKTYRIQMNPIPCKRGLHLLLFRHNSISLEMNEGLVIVKAWFSYVPRIVKIGELFRFQILMTIMILAIALFTYVVRIPVDRRLSGTHQKNRSASYSYDSYDSYDMELGSSGTDWDASFCSFSYIIRTGDRKSPRYLRSL